jgi:hypothetical protein
MPSIDCDIHCWNCGTELSGVDSHEVCPHCASAVDETLSRCGVGTDRLEIEIDLACVGCAYNLRMLPIASRCPECFTPIVRSLGINELMFANPEWLRKVRDGVVVLLATVAAILCLPLLFGAILTQTQSEVVLVILICLWAALCVCFGVGVFRATSSESPDGSVGDRDWKGFLARVLACTPFLLMPLASVTMAPGLALVMSGLRDMASRGAHSTLSIQCTWAMRLLYTSAALYILALGLSWLATGNPFYGILWGSCGGGIVVFAAGIITVAALMSA